LSFLLIAQLFAIVGSGSLARPIFAFLGHPSLAVWLSSSLNIGGAVLNPLLSQAADYWGRKWILVGTTASGMVGSIIVSRAQNVASVIVGFCLMAVVFGGQAASFAVVSEVLPRKDRAIAQGSLLISQSIGGIAGLLFCGALLRDGGLEDFRTYFYVATGFFGLAAAAIVLLYNPPPRALQVSLTQADKIKSLDLIGMVVFATGAVLFSVGLAWSNSPYPWKNAHILGTFTPGLVLLLLFCLYEWRFKKDGIAHHGLFRDSNYTVALTIAFQEGIAVFTLNAYLIPEGILIFGLGVFQASAHFAVVFAWALVLAILSAGYMTRFKALRGPAVFSQCTLLLTFILMATVKPSTPKAILWGYPVFSGLSLGVITTVVFVTAQLSVSGELIAIGTGLVAASRALGGLVGLAVNNAIFNGAVRSNVSTKISAVAIQMGLDVSQLEAFIVALMAGNTEALAAIPGVNPQLIGAAAEALKQGYAVAFRDVWIAAACFTVPGVIGKS
jgi:MFS family permease